MEELYNIMSDFMDIEFDIKTWGYIYEKMKNSYKYDEEREYRYIISSAENNFIYIADEMRSAISRLDNYILDNDKK